MCEALIYCNIWQWSRLFSEYCSLFCRSSILIYD